MKKRTHSQRKKITVHSRRRTSKHLRFHMIFVYSTMFVFGLTILFALAYPNLLKISEKNTAYYSSNNPVLGASQVNTNLIKQDNQSFFSKFIEILLPNKNK